MKYKDWLDVWLKNYIKPTAKRRTYRSQWIGFICHSKKF